ncbi:hypothetical protein FOS14_21455 [Skermania sp. ID1734]|uniref:hypothetical protein n=1 Tax=Skermania sp. ID1734 TaxID=2597516 RepID=UPI00117D483B|nr:hypothetical protein [Skermania sp. ID1734]TSD94096.1 hypothetical protein FOS14_21455 [Skermania sp. ID1734]
MNRTLTAVKEFLIPSLGRHRTVPPMEAGMRPNSRLDAAELLLPAGEYEPEDVALTDSGALVFSSGKSVFEVVDSRVRELASLRGLVGPLLANGAGVLAAVEGVGIVSVGASGATNPVCDDPLVSSCVTDMTRAPDGALLVTVGSHRHGRDEWACALVADDRSGRIVRVDGSQVSVVADALAWPSSIEMCSDTEVLLSLSLAHRIERRSLAALGKSAGAMVANLPAYPGRLAADDDGWWVAAPYVRNRFTELLLDEPELCADMTETIARDEWFVPRLRCVNPYTDTMQMGQLRVLGVVKPWAPARSYGLAFRLDHNGRITTSVHSRVDGDRHGVTGVAAHNGKLIVAAQGFGNLLALQDGKGSDDHD